MSSADSDNPDLRLQRIGTITNDDGSALSVADVSNSRGR